MASAGPAGGVVMFGGQIGEERRTLDTLWLWDGASWKQLSDDGPRYRTLSAAAFDTRRNTLVIFGGAGLANGNRYGDTWEWNGSNWMEHASPSPGPRDHHAIAFDETRGQFVLFGGQNAERNAPNDTWVYDARGWNKVDSTTGPPGVVHHAMAYDSRRGRIVLYGGSTQSRENLGQDVWEWDGARWHRVTPSTPAPRVSRHRMAFDAARGVTVMFAGSETWSWDGVSWRQLSTTGPSQRLVSAMAYDARRQRIVLFGGSGPGGSPPYNSHGDVWEWDGVSWSNPWRPSERREP